MKKSVKIVAHPETGKVITTNSNKPEYGTIRVDQEILKMENGFLNKSRRSAFIAGKIADLEASGLSNGQELPGQIVRTESFTPFYAGQAAKVNPSTGEEVLVNGAKVYFQDKYTEDLSATDSLIKANAVESTISLKA